MHTLIIFLCKSVLLAGVLFLYYWLFLRNKKLYNYNRFFLLTTVIISLVIPFLHFEWYRTTTVQATPTIKLLQAINSDDQEVVPGVTHATDYTAYIVFGIMTLVSAILLVLLLLKIRWIYKLKQHGNVVSENVIDIVYTTTSKAPFSFLNNLFWNEAVDIHSAHGSRIFKHEVTHIRQHHTIDKLAMQLVTIVCWMNPIYWLIQRELSLVHEFIADGVAIQDNDTETFAEMLLTSHYGNMFPDIIHPFFYSPIKRRLIMLSTSNKTKFAYLRRVMVLPLLGVSVLLFSFTINKNAIVNRSEKKIVLALDAGHGGQDKGGTTKSELMEKDMTLKITDKIAELAAAYNVEVVRIRKDDNYISLANRAIMANDANADVFVSVHVNKRAMQNGAGNDYEVTLDEQNERYETSKLLASSMIASLGKGGMQAQLMQKHLWVLKTTKMPAILIECGDIDNAREVGMINDNVELEKMCRNILSGVVDFENSVRK